MVSSEERPPIAAKRRGGEPCTLRLVGPPLRKTPPSRPTPGRREAARGAAVQLQLRRAAAANDFDVAPEHAQRSPGAERLHRRFFRGEAAGKVNRRDAAARSS